MITAMEPMVSEKTFRIGIYNENGPVESVEQNAVGCLRPYAIDAEE
jgi:hypothetical protein